ncbi:MAG: hypothetical protein ACLQGP_37290 [Isosphaeraceae bacterium]
MCRGNRLGGFLVWAAAATMSVAVGAQTAERATSVPLGSTSELQTGDREFAVYIPTRFGGELTVKAADGQVKGLKTAKGQALRNGQDVGPDQEGWATFKVVGAKKPYTVTTIFVQVGQSVKRPWNFYYWPTKADSIHEPWAGGNGRADTMRVNGDDQLIATPGSYIAPGVDIVLAGPNGLLETLPAPGDDATWFPNLYDDLTWVGPNKEQGNQTTIFMTQSPLLKYDQIFNAGARQWEGAYSQSNGISRWPGHCLGGAVASITLDEPTPAPGSGLTRDELKGLWAELGENFLNHRIGDYANDIPTGPPRPGPDATDPHVSRVHAMLETHIRGERRALLANLRAFPPRGMINEVWNHGIYKYIASYHAIPGRGPRAVRVVTELHGNSGSMLNGQDDKDRVVYYEYSLVYGMDGRVDESNPYAADWISVGGEAMFAPLNMMQVLGSRWAGHNPYVTEANVRAVAMANGGRAYGRLAGAPPTFRPVLDYEAGRPRLAVNSPAVDREPGRSPMPRTGGGGFFRGLFRGR